jgi:hypothetical protein
MTWLRIRRLCGVTIAIIAGVAALGGAAMAAAPTPAADTANLVGSYDGGQVEIAAMLELGADGRFHYGLSYGALDEEAFGKWELDGSRVLLTSDPVAAPRFLMLEARPLHARRLELKLDLPQGMDRQYFTARVRLADGRSIERQLSETGLVLPLGRGERAVSVLLLLPVYELAGAPLPLPPGLGVAAHLRFDANDLGKVAFAREPLQIGPEGLVLERYGRQIVFRRTAP